MAVGAPIKIPISYGGAIILLKVDGTNGIRGTASFSYQVKGIEYTWYEAPFIGLNIWYYYCFLAACALAALLVLWSPLIYASVVAVVAVAAICVLSGSFNTLLLCCCCCRKCCRRKKIKPNSVVQMTTLGNASDSERDLKQPAYSKSPTMKGRKPRREDLD